MTELNMAILKAYTKYVAREIGPRDIAIIQAIDGGDIATIRRILEFQRDKFRDLARSQQGEEQSFTVSKANSVQEVIMLLDQATPEVDL
jgi:hypothetical protein